MVSLDSPVFQSHFSLTYGSCIDFNLEADKLDLHAFEIARPIKNVTESCLRVEVM